MLQFGWLLLVRGPKSVDFARKNMCVYLCVKPLRLWILFHIEYAGQSWSIHPMDRTRGNTSTALFLKLYEDTTGNEECMLAWPMKIHVSSLPPPRVSKLAFLQEEILVKKKKLVGGQMHMTQRVCVSRCVPMKHFSDIILNHSRDTSLGESLTWGLRRQTGPQCACLP